MIAASCKLDDRLRFPTNCFQGRILHRHKKEGVGHWLVAYRKEEEQRHKDVRQRIEKTHRKHKKGREDDAPHGNTLDGPLLLRLHCVDKPSDLCSVDISEQKLNAVKAGDLKLFDNVAYIDASVNSLSLDSFSCFTSLRELNLALNGLCNMTFHATDFPHLEVLDFSYNSLSADGIASLGQLPHLKVLHLTGNKLRHLPPNLGSSNYDTTQPLAGEEEDTQFKALEVLMLDGNRLSSGVFGSLRNLKRLKYLNLQGNHISEVPFLELMGSSEPLQTSVEEQGEDKGLASPEPNLNTDERFKEITQENWEDNTGSSLPLPELQLLNLAENKIAVEEALMPVALFPVLREIDIHSNPLTTRRKGDPPLLTHYLHERLGITIKRKKTNGNVKLPLKMSSVSKWKLEDRIPEVSRMLMDAPCPAQTQAEKSDPTVETTPESEGKKSRHDTSPQNTEHFFVTQVIDDPVYEFDHHDAEKKTAVNMQRNEDDTLPETSACYEMLMDVKPNHDVTESIGIQTAVQMLEHTLRNLNVYRDSKPKLDCIQTPYREREKKIKELPPLKPIKQRAERVDGMIKAIKESTTITEVPLSRAVHGTGVNKQEALSLLRDMKTKYKMVHKKTMEQAARRESDTNTNQNRAETLQTL